jgi:hypothetical protein
MARGWESKAIEAQQEEASNTRHLIDKQLTPAQQARHRQIEGLQLARKNIERQIALATNSRHINMLHQSLAELDRQLDFLKQP